MKRRLDPHFKTDLLKLACLAFVIVCPCALFISNPALSTATVLALVVTILISPWVAHLERKGLSRALSIGIIFFSFALLLGSIGFWILQSAFSQWSLFKENVPHQFYAATNSLRFTELHLKSQYSFLSSIEFTGTLLKWMTETEKWFSEHGPALMGQVLTWVVVVPPLSFIFLNEGKSFRRRLFKLIPNRFFESFFLIATEISDGISDYIRAKLIEGLLVGLLVCIGMAIVKAPYAIVLGFAAGITNIVPYLGPLVGAVPGLLITLFDPGLHSLAIPVILVYFFANLIDMAVIFPLIVAKLVKLHPLILVTVVAIGQQYYGLVGMLVSIPVATACKVIFQEIYILVYKQKIDRQRSLSNYGTSSDF